MDKRSPITTHILDTNLGKPAAGIAVTLEILSGEDWKSIGAGTTNADGRALDLMPANYMMSTGVYRLMYETATYFKAQGTKSFFPIVSLIFEVSQPSEHYHVPLLLSAHGFTTYRGS